MGFYIYHLTSLKNFEFILKDGHIYSRNKIKNKNYDDTAEPNIIEKREDWNDYVPFHFTMNTDYTHAVRINHKDKIMINLAFDKDKFYSEENKFTVEHPVSDPKGTTYTEQNYKENYDKIDKNKNKAELLVYQSVDIKLLARVYIGDKNVEHKAEVEKLLKDHQIDVAVTL